MLAPKLALAQCWHWVARCWNWDVYVHILALVQVWGTPCWNWVQDRGGVPELGTQCHHRASALKPHIGTCLILALVPVWVDPYWH